MRTGTEAVHQISGLGVAATRAANRMEAEHERLEQLRALLVSRLRKEYAKVRINESPPDSQMPGTVSATFPGKSGIVANQNAGGHENRRGQCGKWAKYNRTPLCIHMRYIFVIFCEPVHG